MIQQHLLLLKNSFDSVLVVIDLLRISDGAVKRTNTDDNQKYSAKKVWTKNDC